jgi:transcriptional regulator with XRE-family HTH domain
MTKKTHAQLVKTAFRKPGVKKAYDAMEDEFSLLDKMLKARKNAKKTQSDVAKEMKTTTSVVGRLESCGGKFIRGKFVGHSPTVVTLRKYAQAVNCILDIRFKPCPIKPTTKRRSHKTID